MIIAKKENNQELWENMTRSPNLGKNIRENFEAVTEAWRQPGEGRKSIVIAEGSMCKGPEAEHILEKGKCARSYN